MTRFRAPLLGLVAVGFAVVALPLVGAIVTAIGQVEQLAADGREALLIVQRNASVSRNLADRVRELERTARQYQALADAEYKALYEQHRAAVLELVEQLVAVNDGDSLGALLDQAREAERQANEVFVATSAARDTPRLEAAFARLNEHIVAIVRELDARARVRRNALPERATELQDLLVAQAALVIPLSLGLALLFGSRISGAFAQIDRGIRGLGEGLLEKPINVTGTKDLRELGGQLEWLRNRLRELESQKAEFLRNVSHELKTPLSNVREAAELLCDETAPTPGARVERAAILEILRSNSRRLQQMIEELVRYGAISATHSPTHETVRLDTLVSSVIDEYGATPGTRTVAIRSTLQPVTVDGDRNRLRVIVDNLLSNAVKYAPADSEIEVRLRSQDGAVQLDVQDEGPGVSERDVPHLFDWFFTGEQPANAAVPGAGMGLAIAREYAEQQGGGLLFVPGRKGAHFRLILKENVDAG